MPPRDPGPGGAGGPNWPWLIGPTALALVYLALLARRLLDGRP